MTSKSSDITWRVLIDLADFHRARIGKLKNIRAERAAVYTVKVLPDLARILVERGVLFDWPAGFRRLRSAEEGAAVQFFSFWGKWPQDQ